MIDQIKAEIAKIKKKAKSMESATLKNRDGNGHLVAVTQIKLCEKLKKYIKDLQSACPQESDACEDLEKEAEAYWKAQGGGSHAQWDKFRAVVKHFTEWQKRKMMKGAIPFYKILKAVPPGPARETTKIIIIKDDERNT